jgi:hypothetical protein
VLQTALVLAGLLGVSSEEIASATTKNFSRLFHLLGPTWETDRGYRAHPALHAAKNFQI